LCFRNGGKVKQKKGVDRVVWKRKKYEILDESDSSADPVISGKSSNKFEEVPFLAVARSLGTIFSWTDLKLLKIEVHFS